MRLSGKTVFITGASGGIGKPLVSLLEENGANVISYDRSRHGDLIENIERVVEKLKEENPDILINMAGFNDLNFCEEQDLQKIIDLNLMVPMRLCQAVLPMMKNRNNGQIVNVGSMTALIPLPHLTGYVAAKSGLKGFTDSLRRELSGTNITVSHIVPRAVRTAMNTGVKAEVNKRTAVRHDDPEKVANIILKAILSKKKEVRIGWPERFFAFLNAIFPKLIDGGLKKNCQIGESVLIENKQQGEKQ